MKLNELVNFSKDDKENKDAPEKELKEEEIEDEHHVDRTTKIKVIVGVLVVGFAVYVAWWVQEPGAVRADQMMSTVETSETARPTQEISFSDFKLDPVEVHIEKGTTVIWTNKDMVPHTVTGSIFTSGTMDRGGSYSFTFREDGTYDYVCSFHSQITGRIIVGTGLDTQQADTMSLLTGTEEFMPDTDMYPAAGDPLETLDADTIATLDEINAEMLSVTSLSDDTLMTADTGIADAASQPEDLGDLAAGTGGTLDLNNSANEDAKKLHDAAADSDKLASSGPEDILYAGAFAAILFLNRRKLIGALK